MKSYVRKVKDAVNLGKIWMNAQLGWTYVKVESALTQTDLSGDAKKFDLCFHELW